jgi:hypothetical protein
LAAALQTKPALNFYFYVQQNQTDTQLYYLDNYGTKHYAEAWSLGNQDQEVAFSLAELNNTLVRAHKTQRDPQFHDQYVI